MHPRQAALRQAPAVVTRLYMIYQRERDQSTSPAWDTFIQPNFAPVSPARLLFLHFFSLSVMKSALEHFREMFSLKNGDNRGDVVELLYRRFI